MKYLSLNIVLIISQLHLLQLQNSILTPKAKVKCCKLTINIISKTKLSVTFNRQFGEDYNSVVKVECKIGYDTEI